MNALSRSRDHTPRELSLEISVRAACLAWSVLDNLSQISIDELLDLDHTLAWHIHLSVNRVHNSVRASTVVLVSLRLRRTGFVHLATLGDLDSSLGLVTHPFWTLRLL